MLGIDMYRDSKLIVLSCSCSGLFFFSLFFFFSSLCCMKSNLGILNVVKLGKVHTYGPRKSICN
jgi:hypothetical protein